MKVQELPDNGSAAVAVEPEMAGAQDTIYLCNFRVSVDGEWLCLKELQDVEFNMQESIHKVLSPPSPEPVPLFGRDPAVIERSNLVNISKLVVKELIEQSLKYGRMLDSDHMPLQHFFIVLEHVLRHGLKPKKGLLGPKKELWDILQMVEKYAPEAQDITASVRDLPTVRTQMGRARAWLRLALMQKKLADYLKVLIDYKDETLVEYFEPDALMLSDEAIIIIGLLVGLNVVDCNLCVKEEDLDCPQGVIDFSLYLRSSNHISNDSSNDEQGDNMVTVLDQKNYIEELNRHLNATVANLQAKVEGLTTTNALMKEDLAIAKNNLMALYEDNRQLREECGKDPAGYSMSLSGVNMIPANVSEKTATGEVEELKQRLEEERKLRQEADHELEIQTCLKAEMEVAMKLLEKDIHEKQDTIVSLRRQLDDIKLINLEMYKKLQECEMELTQKGEMVSRLQAKAGQIGKILNNLEKYNHLLKDDKRSLDKRSAERRVVPKFDKENLPKTPESSKNTIEKDKIKGENKNNEIIEEKDENKTLPNDANEARLSSDSTDSFVKLDLESEEKVAA
ncbi:protein RUFY3 isoform X3 [Euwallacea fornicatus]|uniref:protein RUFY3 isoform X3 n=1 Tax=Euwallacea fornicatus TaxID=995702 RepID=UPI00338EEA6B